MNGFVVDCSVTMAWCFGDQADGYTYSVLDALRTSRAVVPSIWPLEVANALVVAERRKKLLATHTAEFLAFLEQLPVQLDPDTSHQALGPILALAREHRLSAYDAAYLELAKRRGLPLATRDKGLQRAARAAAVSLLSP